MFRMIAAREPEEQVEVREQYSTHVNAQWVKLLTVLGLDKTFVDCRGVEITTSEGDTYLDFLSGYGVYAAGHYHPRIQAALHAELDGFRPTMLQSEIPNLAAELSVALCQRAGGNLERVFFTSTGSEGIETVIKFSRAHTKRSGILYAEGGFHGLTCGALSLMSNPWWRDGFGPLLPDTKSVPFGDLGAIEQELQTRRYAAFVTEPIQGEAGVIVPTAEYLAAVQALCRRTGTLFVLDEVQTGMYRTGHFLAAHHFKVEPDMVVLAKAMSGGFIPVGAVLMTPAVHRSVYSTLERAFIHASTFGENRLAMRACLATLEVLESDHLPERVRQLGERFREKLSALIPKHQMLREVRGVGLFTGIEFQAPTALRLKMLYNGFSALHPALFGQMVIRQLFHHDHILTQICGNNYLVMKAIPPLTVSEEQLDRFVLALDALLDTVEGAKSSFWTQGVRIAHGALRGGR